MNKKGFFGKIILILLLLIFVFFMLMRLSKAETATDIINATININSSTITLNLSGVIYNFNNSVSGYSIQQNFTYSFERNVTANVTTNITITNSSVQVSCGCTPCTPVACPSVECSLPNGIDLSNKTKDLFLTTYATQLQNTLQGKIEESGNKVSQDVIFKLEPSKVELENYKALSFNSSIKEQEAYRQRDQQLEVNKRLAGLLDDCGSQKRWLEVIGLVLVLASTIFYLFFSGLIEKWGGLGSGGRY